MESDKILPGFDSSDFYCSTCDKRFKEAKYFKEHMKSKNHQRMAERENKALKAPISKESDNEHSSDEDSEDIDELFCDVCDKRFNNYSSYITHINGSIHAKNLKKQKLKEKMSNMSELVQPENGQEESDDEVLETVFARCSICQKAFSGPEPFDAHMKSANHKKKAKQLKLLNNIKTENKDNKTELDDVEFFNKCTVCEKSFSGLIPYQIHMKSAAHKKELDKQKIAEEMKEFFQNNGTEEGYVCKECKKTFTDPAAFKNHLQNNNHEKRKAKNALKEFLNAHPEIIFTTPLDDNDKKNLSDDEEEEKADYFLICKLCHVSFSGPESAKDHVKSKKHMNVKKNKEMIKILKKQKDKEGINGHSPNETEKNKERLSVKSIEKSEVKTRGTPEKKTDEEEFEMI